MLSAVRRSALLLSAAATLAIGAAASAQSRPTTGQTPANGADTARPQASSPYWQGGLTPGEGLLTTTVLALPEAEAAVTESKWVYRLANKNLNLAADHMRRDFEQSDDVAAALDELRAASTAYEQAREAAIRPLRGTPQYDAAMSLRASVGRQIADEQAADEPDLDKLVALGLMRIDYASAAREAERQLIANDPEVKAARQRLVDAGKRMGQLRREFDKDARDSIELADLRQAKAAARIRLLANATYAEALREARAVAIDYGFFSRRVDRLRGYVGGYGYGGYYDGGFGLGGFRSTGFGYPIGVSTVRFND